MRRITTVLSNSNIEIKCRLPDPAATRALVEAISDTPPQTAPEVQTIAADLIRRLGVREADLCSAYAHMVTGSVPPLSGGHSYSVYATSLTGKRSRGNPVGRTTMPDEPKAESGKTGGICQRVIAFWAELDERS